MDDNDKALHYIIIGGIIVAVALEVIFYVLENCGDTFCG